MSKSKSVFETLNSINVSDKIEKKGNLSYLSWAWAWAELKKHYPTSTYTIYENADGLNYHHDGKTAWVKTGVTINEMENIEYLPVMNNRNKSIPVGQITSFDVNSSIQRSLTKAIARHGLGLYVYAGEDLPQDSAPEKTIKPKNTITEITLNIDDGNWEKVMRFVAHNKGKGLRYIVDKLSTKYKIKEEVKKEIQKHV
tara:strand:- start:4150 stop:4743 length:594 start_codon:yes stop_codon:yes gene_type:complete